MKKEIVFSIFLILAIYFISAAHIITTTPSSFSFIPNSSSQYNITINNTDILGGIGSANITQIDITLPPSFSFISDSNGTDSNSSFTNTISILSWVNSTSLVNSITYGNNTKSFWFNLNASDFGEYNLTIAITNSTGTFNYNLSVTIEDTETPSISFTGDTPSNNAQLQQTYIPVEVIAIDNLAVSTVTIFLYDNNSTLLNSESSQNPSFFFNFTGLSEGTYLINATANDTSGNEDSTSSTRTIILNLSSTPGCTSSWGNCTSWSSCTNGNQTRTCNDLNLCNTTTGNVRNETQTCGSTGCTPNWECTPFIPKDECPENETRERTCTDTNNCGTNDGKPDETRTCTFESSSTVFIVIIVSTIVLLVLAGIVAFYYMKSKADEIYEMSSGVSNSHPPSIPPGKSYKITSPRNRIIQPEQISPVKQLRRPQKRIYPKRPLLRRAPPKAYPRRPPGNPSGKRF